MPCFGYMVSRALWSDCGVYTLIWFTYLPGVLAFVMQWPADGELFGAHDLFHACGLRIINGYYRDVSASREVLRSAGRAVIASYECDSALSDSLSQTFKAEAELKPAKRTGALSRALRRMSDCKF